MSKKKIGIIIGSVVAVAAIAIGVFSEQRICEPIRLRRRH